MDAPRAHLPGHRRACVHAGFPSGPGRCHSGDVTTPPLTTDRLLSLLQDVAAEVILPRFGHLADGDVTTKAHATDFVTVADREAEVLLTRRLTAAYPDALVLGEEATATDAGLLDAFDRAEHAFTVDPVDGTKNFVRSSPDFAVMVSEVRRREVVRSWIWQPVHERAYVAERGAGALRVDGPAGTPLSAGVALPPIEVPQDPADWVNRAWDRPELDTALGSRTPSAPSAGACSVDYPHIAEGQIACAVYRGTRPWDHLPGALLLAELGGVVGDVDGRPYDPAAAHGELVAAGSPRVWETVRAHL